MVGNKLSVNILIIAVSAISSVVAAPPPAVKEPNIITQHSNTAQSNNPSTTSVGPYHDPGRPGPSEYRIHVGYRGPAHIEQYYDNGPVPVAQHTSNTAHVVQSNDPSKTPLGRNAQTHHDNPPRPGPSEYHFDSDGKLSGVVYPNRLVADGLGVPDTSKKRKANDKLSGSTGKPRGKVGKQADFRFDYGTGQ